MDGSFIRYIRRTVSRWTGGTVLLIPLGNSDEKTHHSEYSHQYLECTHKYTSFLAGIILKP